METNYDQFVLSYSDDLSFLEDLKQAYLTHPLSNGETVKKMLDAHSIRVLSIFIVGNIEAIIHRWKKEKDYIGELEEYLRGGEIRQIEAHIEKISDLFRKFNISFDEKVIFEYLGIKNLRNAIIHSNLKEKQKEIIVENNYPININDLDEPIYDRLMVVNKKMMRYINEYGLKAIKVAQEFIDILIDEKVPLKFFRNLDLIKSMQNGNEETVKIRIQPSEYTRTLPYALDKGHISSILFYNLEKILMELRKTDENDEKLVANLVESADYCWREYINIRFNVYHKMDTRDIDKNIEIIKMLISDNIDQLEKNELLESLQIARMMDRTIINYTIISLYSSLLKYAKGENLRKITEELNKIVASCRLKEYCRVYEKNVGYPVELNEVEDNIENIIQNFLSQ